MQDVRGIGLVKAFGRTTAVGHLSVEAKAGKFLTASWTAAFRRIWRPLVKNGFVAGWVIQFTVSFSDFATVTFLYGASPRCCRPSSSASGPTGAWKRRRWRR